MISPATSAPGNAGRAILWGGLLAGTFDLAFAFIYYGAKPGVVQAVAGGLLGPAAYRGGAATVLLGILLHYLVSFIWAGLFWIASRQLPVLIRFAVPAGLAYGPVVFYGMNLIVLPLSALRAKSWPAPFAPWPVAMHMLVVGLPIALAAKKFARTGDLT